MTTTASCTPFASASATACATGPVGSAGGGGHGVVSSATPSSGNGSTWLLGLAAAPLLDPVSDATVTVAGTSGASEPAEDSGRSTTTIATTATRAMASSNSATAGQRR